VTHPLRDRLVGPVAPGDLLEPRRLAHAYIPTATLMLLRSVGRQRACICSSARR
jgi:hypothetical protein